MAAQLQEAREQAAKKAREEEQARSDKKHKAETLALQQTVAKSQKQLASQAKAMERQEKETEANIKATAQKIAKDQIEAQKTQMEKSYREKFQGKDLAIADLRKQVTESQTKAHELEAKLSQGSAQAKGIIAEEDLFQHLKKHMTSERCTVEKRGQGKKGTDVIIHVQSKGQPIGAVIVDDKWASTWGSDWPEKIWGDMQLHKADFAYIAVNPSAFPTELKEAGFGVAPCRKAGVCVWVVDRSNLSLLHAILTDTVDKLSKMAEIKAVYGSGSAALKQFQNYLARGYEVDLREKAKHMSAAIRALNDIRKKVNAEHEKAVSALESYWSTEAKVHRSIAGCFGEDAVRAIPQIAFDKEG